MSTEGVMTAMVSYILYKIIEVFMCDRMSEFGNLIVVLLSGGVDFMVLVYIFKY